MTSGSSKGIRHPASGIQGRMPNAKCLAVCAFLVLIASPAIAQNGTAPGMFNVKDVIVQFARFGDPETADSCGLSREDLAAALNKTLKDKGVPATPVTEAEPPVLGAARIELVPEVFSFNSQGLDCTSWLSLTAQSQNSVHIPPVDISRNVMITYWHEGVLLSSSQATHERIIGEALQRLGQKFAQQYKLDQPPALPK